MRLQKYAMFAGESQDNHNCRETSASREPVKLTPQNKIRARKHSRVF